MRIFAKHPISTGDGKGGKIVIPKDTQGSVKAVSNAETIKAAFPNLDHKPDGYFYICSFPNFIDEILCSREQIEFR